MDNCKDAGMPAKGDMGGVAKVANVGAQKNNTASDSGYNSQANQGSVDKGMVPKNGNYYSERGGR